MIHRGLQPDRCLPPFAFIFNPSLGIGRIRQKAHVQIFCFSASPAQEKKKKAHASVGDFYHSFPPRASLALSLFQAARIRYIDRPTNGEKAWNKSRSGFLGVRACQELVNFVSGVTTTFFFDSGIKLSWQAILRFDRSGSFLFG